MSNPNQPITDPREALPNAGEPTPEEAALIAAGTEVDAQGAPLDAAKAAADAEAAAQAAADAAAAEAAAKAEADAAAAAAAAQPAAPAIPAPAAVAPVLPPRPEAPKDFAAERATLKAQYEAGDLDQDDYLEKREALAIEQSRFEGSLAAWQTAQATAAATTQATAEANFTAVALAWEERNAAFIENPLRQKAMQDAIAHVDQQTQFKLSPAELFAEAEKIAFEAYNWAQPGAPAAPVAKTEEQLKAEALAARAKQGGDRGAPTLATAPAAAPMGGGGDFAGLDGKPISDLEDVIARMNPQQLEEYLATSPGSTTTGHEDSF